MDKNKIFTGGSVGVGRGGGVDENHKILLQNMLYIQTNKIYLDYHIHKNMIRFMRFISGTDPIFIPITIFKSSSINNSDNICDLLKPNPFINIIHCSYCKP